MYYMYKKIIHLQSRRSKHSDIEFVILIDFIIFLFFQSKEPFIDPEFPPADVSLYVDVKRPVSRWRVYQWQRPEDVVDPHSSRKTKWAVLRNPGPEDIAQGVLGNCW